MEPGALTLKVALESNLGGAVGIWLALKRGSVGSTLRSTTLAWGIGCLQEGAMSSLTKVKSLSRSMSTLIHSTGLCLLLSWQPRAILVGLCPRILGLHNALQVISSLCVRCLLQAPIPSRYQMSEGRLLRDSSTSLVSWISSAISSPKSTRSLRLC